MPALVSTVDRAITRRVAALPPSPIDATLRTITATANAGQLWIAIAATLATRSGPSRTAATTGLTALGATAVATNTLLKPLFRRARPEHGAMPSCRSLDRQPRSTSFPSGHSATAAAFATAVGLAHPRAGLAVAPLAALVAYSRVHVGAHWPSDVVAGSVVGAVIAAALRRAR